MRKNMKSTYEFKNGNYGITKMNFYKLKKQAKRNNLNSISSNNNSVINSSGSGN